MSVSGEGAGLVAGIEYPPGELRPLAFSEQPVRVYSGEVTIAVRFSQPPAGKRTTLSLYYQACDERACLPPVTKTVDVVA